jgi:hypothetical protein
MIKKCTRIIKHIAAKYKMQQGVADFFFPQIVSPASTLLLGNLNAQEGKNY